MKEQRGHVRKAVQAAKQMMRQIININNPQFDQTMLQMMVNAMHVVEFYSPPRIADMAKRIGFMAGWSLEITIHDTDGRAWGFNSLEMRNRAARRVLRYKPLLLSGSLMCTIHSIMNNINHPPYGPRYGERKVRRRKETLGVRS